MARSRSRHRVIVELSLSFRLEPSPGTEANKTPERGAAQRTLTTLWSLGSRLLGDLSS